MNPLNVLDLTVRTPTDSRAMRFPVRRVVNAGFVGRDQAALRAHVEELAREGIPAPTSVPMVFPFQSANVTTAERIEVIGGETSGEVEFVLLLREGEIYVGVGSDHTDRALERLDMVKSKQICANVLSRDVWSYADVKKSWDELLLQSWVRPSVGAEEVLYQEARLGSIMPVEALLDFVQSRMCEKSNDGLVIYSGTIPLVAEKTIYGETFRCRLLNPNTEQHLSCSYRVEQLKSPCDAGC